MSTEYIYALLSLSSKMFLGLLLYINVLMFSSFNEALNNTDANAASAAAAVATMSA